jgi:hypothetical protein
MEPKIGPLAVKFVSALYLGFYPGQLYGVAREAAVVITYLRFIKRTCLSRLKFIPPPLKENENLAAK